MALKINQQNGDGALSSLDEMRIQIVFRFINNAAAHPEEEPNGNIWLADNIGDIPLVGDYIPLVGDYLILPEAEKKSCVSGHSQVVAREINLESFAKGERIVCTLSLECVI